MSRRGVDDPVTKDSLSPHISWKGLGAFEILNVPVWLFDVEQDQIVWANKAALELWRASSVDDIQKRRMPELSETARARVHASLEMVKAGQVFDDYWTVYPGGEPVTFEATFSGAALADGRLGLLTQARIANEREFPGELKRRVESYRHAPSPISLHRPDGAAFLRNPAAIRAFGPLDEAAGKDDLAQQLGGEEPARNARRAVEQNYVHRLRVPVTTRAGDRWFDVELRKMSDPLTGHDALLYSAQDVTEAQRAEQRLAAEKRVLELISTGKSLGTVLDALTSEIEKLSPEMKCSVLLLDGDGIHIRHASAPSLPEAFRQAIDGQSIGPAAGSCGTAMFRGETVISSDIATDPLWVDYRELALSHGLRACCSVPILSPTGKVLGSFAAYYGKTHAPDEKQLALLEIGRHIAGIAIERDRATSALHSRSEQLQMVMDAMPFSIAYADRNFRYVVVNRRFEELFHRSREGIIGEHTWDVIGKELFEQIKPHMDRVMQGEVVTYERSRVDGNGNVHHLEVLYLPQVGEGGVVLGHFGIVQDITDRKRDEAMLQFLANHDQLTKLPNRNQFAQSLVDAIARAARYKHRVGVLFIDLDRFKNVNDTLGHESGDTLLVAVAERFRKALRETDSVARLGGDEFTVILEEIGEAGEIATTAQRLLENLAAPFDVQGQEVFASASIGISIYPEDGPDATTLLRNADMAMYRAKEMGKNTFQFFTQDVTVASIERLQLESSLRRAIERGEFILHFQPIVDLASRQIVGMEALVRWMHPDLGMVPPAQFIPLAEETGLIVQIGNWVLEQACRQTRALNQSRNLNLTVSVNLSPRQFRRRDLAHNVAAILAATGLPASKLELEVTESSVMDDPEAAVVTLQALKAMGVHLSVDDFGTGYSSLSQLKRFPIDSLKIDQSFVRDIPADQDDAAITGAIVAMGHRLRLKLIAEGVETPEQLAFLKELGCDLAQGYLFGKPMAADEFAEFLERELPRHPL